MADNYGGGLGEEYVVPVKDTSSDALFGSAKHSSSRKTRSKITQTCVLVSVGPFLLLGGAFLLLCSEIWDMFCAKELDDAMLLTTSIEDANKFDSALDGSLVYITGSATAGPSAVSLYDAVFGITAPRDALKLSRDVEMYQWYETNNTDGYTYSADWYSTLVLSASFDSALYTNPTSMATTSYEFVVNPMTLGALNLSDDAKNLIDWYVPYEDPDISVDSISTTSLGSRSIVLDEKGGFYIGNDDGEAIVDAVNDPVVGYTEVDFEVIEACNISAIGMQYSGQLLRYKLSSDGDTILMIYNGIYTKSEMLTDYLFGDKPYYYQSRFFWVCRGVSLVLLTIGTVMIMKPFRKFFMLAPPKKYILFRSVLVSVALALFYESIIFAVVWSFYAVWIAIVSSIALVALIIMLVLRRKKIYRLRNPGLTSKAERRRLIV